MLMLLVCGQYLEKQSLEGQIQSLEGQIPILLSVFATLIH